MELPVRLNNQITLFYVSLTISQSKLRIRNFECPMSIPDPVIHSASLNPNVGCIFAYCMIISNEKEKLMGKEMLLYLKIKSFTPPYTRFDLFTRQLN